MTVGISRTRLENEVGRQIKMKKMKKPVFYLGAILLFMTSCAYQRIGDLTMISNRNVDSGKDYVLIQRNAEGKAKMKKDDALERAIDAATEEYNGEYLMNVKVYVKSNGKKIKVEGDVWGLKSTQVNVESSVTKKVEFENGDTVTFQNSGKLTEGKIIGINENGAIVEYSNMLGQTKSKEIPFDELTKIERE
jgi:hypothetical protein